MATTRKTEFFSKFVKLGLNSKIKQPKRKGLPEKPDPACVHTDYIGPPDKESNLKPYVRFIPNNETTLATKLREKRIEVENWNQEFWTRHNKRFYDDKQDFILAHKVGENEISADRMSQFYKSFLDKNKKIHLLYNVSWYLKNFDLLVMSFQVNVQNVWRKVNKQ